MRAKLMPKADDETPSLIAPKLESKVELITPIYAQELLDRSAGNRTIRALVVDRYRRAMYEDRWRLDGSPIRIDTEGRLVDGHHRLTACIAANRSFRSIVIYGVETIALLVVDTGATRNFGNVLSFRGEKDVAQLSTAIRLAWQWDHAGDEGPDERLSMSHEEGVIWLEANPGIRDAARLAATLRPLRLPVSVGGAFAYRVLRENEEMAREFFALARAGEGLRATDPVFALRRWLANAGQRHGIGRYGRSYLLALVIKTWNAWVQHRPVNQLVVRHDDPFPVLLTPTSTTL